jgi:hypothetical protein
VPFPTTKINPPAARPRMNGTIFQLTSNGRKPYWSFRDNHNATHRQGFTRTSKHD